MKRWLRRFSRRIVTRLRKRSNKRSSLSLAGRMMASLQRKGRSIEPWKTSKRFKKEPFNSRNESRKSKRRQRTRSAVRNVKNSWPPRMIVALSTLRTLSQCLLVPKSINLVVKLLTLARDSLMTRTRKMCSSHQTMYKLKWVRSRTRLRSYCSVLVLQKRRKRSSKSLWRKIRKQRELETSRL